LSRHITSIATSDCIWAFEIAGMKRASLQRVISTFVLRTSAARNHFDFKVALAAYPCSGGDTPQQHDGNAGVGFTVSMGLLPFTLFFCSLYTARPPMEVPSAAPHSVHRILNWNCAAGFTSRRLAMLLLVSSFRPAITLILCVHLNT